MFEIEKHRPFYRFLAVLIGLAAAATVSASDWPQVLGPGRDGVYRGSLATTWPAAGPRQIWSREVGSGFAGPAVSNGKVLIYHRRGDHNLVEALAAETGKPLWSFEHPTSYKDQLGFDDGPRATPTIADGQVFTWSSMGKLHALDFETGEMLWTVDAHQRYGADQGTFGAASAPLYDDGRLIVAVGGREGAGIIAFDAESGAVLWQTSDDAASYAAPIRTELRGRKRLLVWTSKQLYDLDPSTGSAAASFAWRARTNAVTPLVVGDRIFLSANYGKGAVVLDASQGDLTPVWSSNDVLSNHYAISVHRQGHLYGFHGMALSRTSAGVSLRCVDLDSGQVVWEWEETGAGAVILAEDQLLVLRDDGELVLAPASPQRFQPTARAAILEAPVRALPALAHGRLYARDPKRLVALVLSADATD